MEVSLQDTSKEAVDKAIARADKHFKKRLRGDLAVSTAKARLFADVDGVHVPRADVVIEAIFENLEAKQKLFQAIEPRLKPGAILATNTSSIRIETIAEALADPGRLIGLHFFNPVAQMPLVEVVRGQQSREEETGKGCAFVTAIGKFPLIVKSCPGFLVNRVLAPYMCGGHAPREEGTAREKIDAAALEFGMPMGPIELADVVGLDMLHTASRRFSAAACRRIPNWRGCQGWQARQEDRRGFLHLGGRQTAEDARRIRQGRIAQPRQRAGQAADRRVREGAGRGRRRERRSCGRRRDFRHRLRAVPWRAAALSRVAVEYQTGGRRGSRRRCITGGVSDMQSRTMRPVAVIGGVRTPFCRSNTAYQELTNLDLMTAALNGLVTKFGLEGQHIDEVVGGAVVTHSKDFNLTREAVIGTKLHPNTPGITLSQACGTSLQAALGSAAKIATGQIDCAIATGSDTISDAPIVFQRKFAQRLAKFARTKGFAEKAAALLKGFSPAELTPLAPSVNEPRTGLSMGQHCELMAQEYLISREDQDQLAFESHKKAAAAYDEGFMDDLLTPTAGVFRDNNLREDIDLAKLATLKTAFEKSARGTLTAANSTPLTDGASAVLLASEEWAAAHGLKPQAYLTHAAHSAIDFVGGQGLLMAPTIAVAKLLDQAGLTLQDFDFYEIHEAFAAQVLATLKAWESPEYCREVLGREMPLGAIDRAKLNVKGSSLAVGHPFAATGGRIIATLAKLLEQRGGGRGLISICTAGGMGVAAVLERPATPTLH